MDTASIHLIYITTGALAGLTAGLLGIGGGLVMVPALLVCFALAGMPAEVIPALALGTSLANVCFASALASREQARLGQLSHPFSVRMLAFAACLALGMAAGASVTTRLPHEVLLWCLAIFQLAMGAWMLWGSCRRARVAPPAAEDQQPAQDRLRPAATGAYLVLTGAVCSVSGIGGATLVIPYALAAGVDYRRAAALASFFGCMVGAAGFVSYGLLTRPAQPLPGCLGYVSVPAFISLALGSLLFVRMGARWSQRWSKQALTRAFSICLLASGFKALLPLAVLSAGH